MELGEIDAQVSDRLAGQRHHAGLVPLASEGHVPGLGHAQVLQGQSGDLRHARRGVVEQDEQHPVAAGLGGRAGVRGQDRPYLGRGEVGDGLAGLGRGLECPGCLAERDEGDVLLGRVGQERLHGTQPQRDGLRRVALMIGHPG